MNRVTFCVMDDFQYKNALVKMMLSLYQQDEAAHPPNYSLFPATIEHLISNPSGGRIVLFHKGDELAGYAILIPYWSNEFGGVLLFIDELFVSPAHRNRGIARSLFRYLEQHLPFDAVAFALEVSPSNRNASRLYESLGFLRRPNATLIRSLDLPPDSRISIVRDG